MARALSLLGSWGFSYYVTLTADAGAWNALMAVLALQTWDEVAREAEQMSIRGATRKPELPYRITEAAELRAKAEKCLRLARSLPPGPDAEMMKLFALEYLELAVSAERDGNRQSDGGSP